MDHTHVFKVGLTWELSDAQANSPVRTSKNHRICIDQKPDLEVSAAKAFKGDPTRYNPEDLLLSSLASCHMMSFLYCCGLEKITVVQYQDHAQATLKVNSDGSGSIIQADLFPEVQVSEPWMVAQALELHAKASSLCFIANSCAFKVQVHPSCSSL